MTLPRVTASSARPMALRQTPCLLGYWPVKMLARAGAQTGVAAFLGKRARLTSPFALDLVGGLPAEIAQDELEKLAANPDIEGISIDAPV